MCFVVSNGILRVFRSHIIWFICCECNEVNLVIDAFALNAQQQQQTHTYRIHNNNNNHNKYPQYFFFLCILPARRSCYCSCSVMLSACRLIFQLLQQFYTIHCCWIFLYIYSIVECCYFCMALFLVACHFHFALFGVSLVTAAAWLPFVQTTNDTKHTRLPKQYEWITCNQDYDKRRHRLFICFCCILVFLHSVTKKYNSCARCLLVCDCEPMSLWSTSYIYIGEHRCRAIITGLSWRCHPTRYTQYDCVCVWLCQVNYLRVPSCASHK